MIRKFRKNRGFSLIELALVLAIVGLAAGTILESYRQHLRTKIKNDTSNHQTIVQKALERFIAVNGRLPCPADPTLRPGEISGANIAIKGGEEVCNTSGSLGGVIEVPGHRKTSSSLTWPGWDTNPASAGYGNPPPAQALPFDPVRIGTLPYVTLGISIRDTLDGYGNRFTYAVSFYMTDKNRFNYHNGVIDVVKLENAGLATEKMEKVLREVSSCPLGSDSQPGTSMLATCNANDPPVSKRVGAVLYVVVSHGRDGKGAYTYEGERAIPCGTTGGRDNESCDDDRTFVDGSPESGVYSTVHRPAPGYPALVGSDPDVFFDDPSTLFTLKTDNDKWAFNSSTQMYNKTRMKVGIGVKLPQAALHVGGNIRVNQDTRMQEYCSPSWDDLSTSGPGFQPDKPSYCFPISKIVGPDGSISGTGIDRAMGCPGAMMTGIALANATCETQQDFTVLSASPECTGGQFAKGIDASGSIVCVTP
ncbi:MAG: type II secretion system protein [bacterium]|nr:type II secretion system protein [bacterium]